MEKKGSDKSQKRSTKKAKSNTVNAVKPEKVVVSEQKEKTKQQEELTQSVAVSEEKPHRPPSIYYGKFTGGHAWARFSIQVKSGALVLYCQNRRDAAAAKAYETGGCGCRI